MATKDELEEQINDRLGLEFEWSKMKKDDLKEFREGLEDEEFIKRFVAQLANDKTGDFAENQINSWEPGALLGTIAQAQQMGISPKDILGFASDKGEENEEIDLF